MTTLVSPDHRKSSAAACPYGAADSEPEEQQGSNKEQGVLFASRRAGCTGADSIPIPIAIAMHQISVAPRLAGSLTIRFPAQEWLLKPRRRFAELHDSPGKPQPVSPIQPADLLAIAHIARPHGVRGELSAIALAPPVLAPESLLLGRTLIGRDPRGRLSDYTAIGFRPHQGRWLIQLEGVTDRTQADALRGHDLCLRRRDLPDLPEGWYWESDLEQCRVVDRRLGEIGRVEGLDTSGVQPYLTLIRPDGRRAMIPWRSALVPAVDLEAGVIETDLPGDFPGISE